MNILPILKFFLKSTCNIFSIRVLWKSVTSYLLFSLFIHFTIVLLYILQFYCACVYKRSTEKLKETTNIPSNILGKNDQRGFQVFLLYKEFVNLRMYCNVCSKEAVQNSNKRNKNGYYVCCLHIISKLRSIYHRSAIPFTSKESHFTVAWTYM